MKKFLGNALIYTIASALNAAVPFLLVPIFTRHLSREDYGILTMFGALSAILMLFSGLSTVGAVQRRYYDREEIDFPSYVVSSMWIWGASSLLVTIFIIAIGPAAGHLIKLDYPTILWILPIVFLNYPNRLLLALWRAQGKAYAFGATQVGLTVLQIAGAIVLVVGAKMAWEGRLIAQGVAAFLGAAQALWFMSKEGWLNGVRTKEHIQHALHFGVPLIPHTLGSLVMLFVGRIAITNIHGLEEAGLFAVGAQIGLVANLVADALNSAYVPYAYSELKRGTPEARLRLVKVKYGIVALSAVTAVGIWLLGPLLGSVMLGRNFLDATVYIGWAGLAGALQIVYYTFVTLLFFEGRTRLLARISLAAAVASVPATFALVAWIGPIGASVAQVALKAAMVVLVVWAGRDVGSLPWSLQRVT